MKKLAIVFIAYFLISCEKFLDEKPDAQLAIPSTIEDLQALLDFASAMNQREPGVGEGSADDYYLTSADWASMQDEGNRNVYIWGSELFFANTTNDWVRLYETVYRANLALEEIEKIEINLNNKSAWENLKGSALFFRSKAFLNAVQIWAKAYDQGTAASEPGIPIRLSTDFNITSTRASIKESYEQIIKDLETAVRLLPLTPVHVFRPSKTAAYAMLARTHLVMRNYNYAKLYADSSLQLYNVLIDYNTLNAAASFPFSRFNKEVIFHSSIGSAQYISQNLAKIDSNLYRSYHLNDLRRSLFFRNNANGTFSFKGTYDGSSALFNGISTGELFLIRAEGHARDSNRVAALNDLNTLLIKRWKTGTFLPFTASSSREALNIILQERRKELLMRDRRLSDIKRLNKEGAGISITRFINGQEYKLLPNDNRFALPLPQAVIDLTGMPQNQR